MSYADYIFVQNCNEILKNGFTDEGLDVRPKWPDGTPAHTAKILHVCNKYPLSKDSIPVMTLRKTGFRNAVDEILWIYQKKSNRIADLNSHIWDSWDVGNGTIGRAYGYQIGKVSKHHSVKYAENQTTQDIQKMYKDYPSAYVNPIGGSLPDAPDGSTHSIARQPTKADIYMDQMDAVLWDLKHNPSSRSIITNTYNHQDLADMGLRPCAFMMSYNVSIDENGNKVLNGCLTQRSQDMLTANNWNVVQYAVLLQMVAQVSGMLPGTLTHMVFDMHIYDRHIPLVQSLLDTYRMYNSSERYSSHDIPVPNPTFWINPEIKNFYDFTVDDVKLLNYHYLNFDHKIEVAI